MSVKDDFLDKMFKDFNVLVDEFDYRKNTIEQTKYFIKYLLIEFYCAATRPDSSVKARLKKLKDNKKDTN